MRGSMLLLAAGVLLAGCTWVKMTPQGAAVRVAAAEEDLSACQRRGEIAVSVEDRVAFYRRSSVKVRDELETLARNEAISLDADTVQPKTEPEDGEQRFVAFRCGAGRPASERPATPDSAETFPIEQQRR